MGFGFYNKQVDVSNKEVTLNVLRYLRLLKLVNTKRNFTFNFVNLVKKLIESTCVLSANCSL